MALLEPCCNAAAPGKESSVSGEELELECTRNSVGNNKGSSVCWSSNGSEEPISVRCSSRSAEELGVATLLVMMAAFLLAGKLDAATRRLLLPLGKEAAVGLGLALA